MRRMNGFTAMRSALRTLGGVTAAVATGCGGIGAGDDVVYRVAFTEPVASGDCANPGEDDAISSLRGSGTMVIYGAGEAEQIFLDLAGVVMPGAATDGGFDFGGERVETQDFGGQTIFDSDHEDLDEWNGDDPLVDSDNDGLDEMNGDDMDVDVDMDGLDDLFDVDNVDVDNDGEDDRYVTINGATGVQTLTYEVSLVVDGENVSGTQTETMTFTCEGTCPGFTGETCRRSTTFVGIEIDETSIDVQ